MGFTLKHLKPGETAIVGSFIDNEVSLKLIELGIIPGSKIKMLRRAPMGDPIAFSFSGSIISMRQMEAETVLLEDL